VNEQLVRIELRVNGEPIEAEIPPHRGLLEFLRGDLHLTGTKEGCDTGVCGICTILMDREPVKACLMLAVQAQGHELCTIEGIGSNGALSPIQDAFVRYGGIQCGICTPAMVVTATALVEQVPSPSEEAVREFMAGTLCRCTGYQKIVDAILAATQQPAGAIRP
jgi:carbon-monoxide dehydrogenase small subunit